MKKFLLSLLAVILIIEEWLWDFLSGCAHFLIRLLRLESVERWLSQTSPAMALLAISIPILIVTPLNLAAIWLLVNGLLLQGILLEIVAKLLGTFLVARVFTLTKSQLLTFKFIAVIYNTVSGWLRWAHAKVADTAIYKAAKQVKVQVKMWLKKVFRSQ